MVTLRDLSLLRCSFLESKPTSGMLPRTATEVRVNEAAHRVLWQAEPLRLWCSRAKATVLDVLF